jgi:hypothetical protein
MQIEHLGPAVKRTVFVPELPRVLNLHERIHITHGTEGRSGAGSQKVYVAVTVESVISNVSSIDFETVSHLTLNRKEWSARYGIVLLGVGTRGAPHQSRKRYYRAGRSSSGQSGTIAIDTVPDVAAMHNCLLWAL